MLTKWKVEEVWLKDVKPFDSNPRTMDETQTKGLWASLYRFGYVDLIVWNRTTGNIVGGHQRYKLLLQQGVEKAKMLVVEFSEEEELAANLTLNNPAIEGKFTDPIFDLLNKIESFDTELFRDMNFEDLRKDVSSLKTKLQEDLTDTKCPCCSHKWRVDASDVILMSPQEQELKRNGG